MPEPTSKSPSSFPRSPQDLTADQRARLKAELKAPYRGLRQFIYIAFGASGLIGAFVFFAQLLSGKDVANVVPNLALQVGVVALMVWLFRLEQRASRKSQYPKRMNDEG